MKNTITLAIIALFLVLPASAQVTATAQLDTKMREQPVPAGEYITVAAGSVVTILDFLTDSGVTAYLKVKKGDEVGYIIHPDLIAHEVVIGMRASMIFHVMGASPQDINRTTTEHGTREQWIYDDNTYIYVEGGVVTAIQN